MNSDLKRCCKCDGYIEHMATIVDKDGKDLELNYCTYTQCPAYGLYQ